MIYSRQQNRNIKQSRIDFFTVYVRHNFFLVPHKMWKLIQTVKWLRFEPYCRLLLLAFFISNPTGSPKVKSIWGIIKDAVLMDFDRRIFSPLSFSLTLGNTAIMETVHGPLFFKKGSFNRQHFLRKKNAPFLLLLKSVSPFPSLPSLPLWIPPMARRTPLMSSWKWQL